ncbi:unnamed protein product [Ilex paraguariensis]|uniref:BHLH domain-containing protein n=1 Tax=Ilex paraguariensis TaxID=185542 RepID=A0ABC8SR30_9AQUA
MLYIDEIIPKSMELSPKNANQVGNMEEEEEEISDSFPKLSEMYYYLSNTSYNQHDQKLCLSSFPTSGQTSRSEQLAAIELLYPNTQTYDRFQCAAPASYYNLNHVPRTSIPNLQLSSLVSNSFGLNLSTGLISNTNRGGGCDESLEESIFLSNDHMQDQSSIPKQTSSASGNEATRTKRLNNIQKEQPFPDQAAKKCRFLSKSSCPALKVRKEKLGDRIAALHKLVAPFGKTDTASVLTEAIGYIKFLQDQIQTLSVPCMESSGSKPRRLTMQRNSRMDERKQEEQQMNGLRSRGLCLVPLSLHTSLPTMEGYLSDHC